MEADFWFWFMAPVGIVAGSVAAIVLAIVVLVIVGVITGTIKYFRMLMK